MGGETTLLSALLQNPNEYLARDPMYRAGIGIMQQPIAAPQNNTQAFLLPFLQGLGGGTIAGLGRGIAEDKLKKDNLATSQALLGSDYQLPDSWTPENSQSSLAAAVMNHQNEQDRQIEAMKQQSELAKALLPYSDTALTFKTKEAQAQEAAKLPTLTRGLEDTTYKRITDLPSYKQFAEIEPNFKTILAVKDDQSAPATVAMLTSFARLMDPGSSVREGEVATVGSNAQSYLDKIAGNWRLAFEGKSVLSQEAKDNMAKVAATKFNEFGKKYSGEKSALVNALKQLGGEPANIPTVEYQPWNQPSASQPSQVPPGMKLQRNAKTGETRLVPQ